MFVSSFVFKMGHMYIVFQSRRFTLKHMQWLDFIKKREENRDSFPLGILFSRNGPTARTAHSQNDSRQIFLFSFFEEVSDHNSQVGT